MILIFIKHRLCPFTCNYFLMFLYQCSKAKMCTFQLIFRHKSNFGAIAISFVNQQLNSVVDGLKKFLKLNCLACKILSRTTKTKRSRKATLRRIMYMFPFTPSLHHGNCPECSGNCYNILRTVIDVAQSAYSLTRALTFTTQSS